MAQDFEATPLADADGCVETLYNYLWQKNSQGLSCPGVHVPETVVYKYRQPAYWFFTSSQDRQLKKKNRVNIVNARIFDSFTKRKSAQYQGVDVCSYHIYSSENDDGTPHGRHETPNDITTIEYFDEASFKQFLFHGEKTSNGVLQKFIPAKGEYQTVIRATWSPQVCLLERRVNNYKLRDKAVEMFERCVTFDGQEHLSTSSPLTGSSFAAQIQFVCNSIVEHVYEVSNRRYRISRMICNFKLDADNKLWFLWCSSLRLAKNDQTARPAQPVNLNPNFVVKPKSRFLIQPKKGPPVLQHMYFKCPGCREVHEVRNKYEVTYKAVLQHWEKLQGEQSKARKQFAITGNKSIEMPPILATCEPRLTQEKFEVVRSDPTFLYRNASMCESCCLQHNHTALTTLEKDNPAVSFQQLMPRSGSAGMVRGGLGGNPPWIPPRDSFLALQETHSLVPTSDNIKQPKPGASASASKTGASMKPRAASARSAATKTRTLTPDALDSTFERLSRPPSAPPVTSKSRLDTSPSRDQAASPYTEDLASSSLEKLPSPTRRSPSPKRDKKKEVTNTGSTARDKGSTAGPSSRPQSGSSIPSVTEPPFKSSGSSIYSAYNDRMSERHGMHAYGKQEVIKTIYNSPYSASPRMPSGKPPRAASAGPSRTAKVGVGGERIGSGRGTSSSRPGAKPRVQSASPTRGGGGGGVRTSSQLTESQEEVVRQAIANTGLGADAAADAGAHPKAVRQDLDKLLDDLQSEASTGDATRMYNAMLEKNNQDQAGTGDASSAQQGEGVAGAGGGDGGISGQADSTGSAAGQGGAGGEGSTSEGNSAKPSDGIMSEMTEEERLFLLKEVGELGEGDIM
mmetsp:Transcript_42098/g.51074  ORF Transcript_42098/g.51074 Transcript_42098/m.51074 type:complete len:853 (+) Transcript_42098:117-2675(+)